ncbi:MAG: UDP-N-acetylglucosamine 2-epimerase (non-hydrolyzing) [Paludibacteraceae bacterium]|nr:UDP-N-acetylglucosamine 2-epimerase (non-hydrolyzing) [Paludibacteraceae bacterium]
MKKLLTIIGARPQIIKAAALSHTIREKFSSQIQEKILHTGQHYDNNMSQVFFDELDLPTPDYNLGVGSGSHGHQTAMMIEGIEKVLMTEHFDGIVLYGDTNSTLAGAVAASKLHIPIFHVEAGLRSYNMSMPEEVNRMVCDQLSSILFAPTQTAVNNLIKEGFETIHPTFKDGTTRKICLSGDVMYDNAQRFAKIAEQRCDITKRLKLEAKQFILATIHRPSNTDDSSKLALIFKALANIASQEKAQVIIPLHPRTAKLIDQEKAIFGNILSSPYFRIIPPVSFLEILMLEKNAKLVMTDSGGVQKEAFFFETPTVILREETEWVEIVEHGAGILAGADYCKIVDAYHKLANSTIKYPPLFGNGHAAETIIKSIIAHE